MKYTYAIVEQKLIVEIVASEVELTVGGYVYDITGIRPTPQVGWKYFEDNNTFKPQKEADINVEASREEGRGAIDRAAGLARARYITIIAGQQEVYREKFEEAVDYLTHNGDSTFPDEDYPMLLVETAIRDVSMRDIAEEIIRSKKQWVKRMASIELLRLGGKYDIDLCSTIEEIQRLKHNYVHKLNLA